jgi:flavin-dependent dehydrogenase
MLPVGSVELPTRCDVVVIGGGPSGSTAASSLSAKGYDVVLLEKQAHPRYAVGEALIPQFWRYADAIGASPAIASEGFIQKTGGTVAWNGVIRQMSFGAFGYTKPALHVERDRFDQLLLEHARTSGARVHERVTVLSADMTSEGSAVGYRTDEGEQGLIRCRFVIDATGQTALLGRRMGVRVLDDAFRFMAIWGYFEGGRYVALDGKAHPFAERRRVGPTTFVSSIPDSGGWGWAWHIVLRESVSVGLVLPRERFRQDLLEGDGLEASFAASCGRVPWFDLLLDGATLRPGSVRALRDYSYRATEVAGPGYFLVGDAAAFVDPVFSVGVALAMYSGFLAAWSIHGSLRRPASTERNRGIFVDQLRTRLEVGRALALPRLGAGEDDMAAARHLIGFESALAQELFYVASTLTTRSDNLKDLAPSGGVRTSDKLREIAEITPA